MCWQVGGGGQVGTRAGGQAGRQGMALGISVLQARHVEWTLMPAIHPIHRAMLNICGPTMTNSYALAPNPVASCMLLNGHQGAALETANESSRKGKSLTYLMQEH